MLELIRQAGRQAELPPPNRITLTIIIIIINEVGMIIMMIIRYARGEKATVKERKT